MEGGREGGEVWIKVTRIQGEDISERRYFDDNQNREDCMARMGRFIEIEMKEFFNCCLEQLKAHCLVHFQ